ncbi:MAG: BrnT family toxin [ANME-2 cluster archaeon]|nr:BrnT family toxin [ANME-2 cluster archaeon]
MIDKLEEKHNVKPKEVKEVLCGKPKFRFVEKGFHPNDNVYAAMGRSKAGRYLIIFIIYKKDNHILIVSARDMTDGERKRYGQK